MEYKVLLPKDPNDSWSQGTETLVSSLDEVRTIIDRHTNFLPEPYRSQQRSAVRVYKRKVEPWQEVTSW